MADFHVDFNGNITTKKKKKKQVQPSYHVGMDGTITATKQEEESTLEKALAHNADINTDVPVMDLDVAPVRDENLREATLMDLTINSIKRGYYNARYGEESYAAMTGAKNDKAVYQQILQGDDYQFQPTSWVGEAVSGASELLGQMWRQSTHPRTLAIAGGAAGAAAIAGQAGPQALVPEEVVSVPTAFAAGLAAGNAGTALEIEAGHAYNEMVEAGISHDTAYKIAMGVGVINASLEALQVDELLDAYRATKGLGATKSFTQRIINELLKRGVDVAKETAQEVTQEGVTITGTQVASKIEKGEYAYSAEDVTDRLLDTAKSSALSFGVMNVPAAGKNIASISTEQYQENKLTTDEKTVYDKATEALIAEREKKYGRELTDSEKRAAKKEIRENLDHGGINIEKIEEILGGESYDAFKSEWENFVASEGFQTYKAAEANENKQIKEIEDQLKELEDAPSSVRDALQSKLEELKTHTESKALKAQLDPEALRILGLRDKMRSEVVSRVKGSRLAESYLEYARSKEKLDIDINKYTNEHARKTVQAIIDSGLGDNSNAFKHWLDFVANVSARTGVSINLTNNERLFGTDHARDGLTTNGYKITDKNGVTIVVNKDSPNALRTIVGHEFTHVLESNPDLYKAMADSVLKFAETKEGLANLNARIKTAERIYKGDTNTTPEKEVVADLIGEYVFTDYEFISNLAKTNHKGFMKLFDEVKYMARVATAGSKEARDLARVKNDFERAFREYSQGQGITADESGMQHSYSRPNFNQSEWSIVNRRKYSEFDNPKFDIDKDTKWMYVNEKGSTVFAVYSKHDADDPTVLYGSRGKKAERDYAELSDYLSGRQNHGKRNWSTIDRLLRAIERKTGNRGTGVYLAERGQSTIEDVPLPLGQQGSNSGRNLADGTQDRQATELTEYNEEASDDSGASFITFSNDYAAIRNYMKDGDTEDSGKTQYSLSVVEAVEPKSDLWHRTHTTDEAKAIFPDMWNVAADDSEVRNPTQITSTVKSYRKVYDALKAEGFDGTILDASSGLGYGTKAGIEEYGFDVEDIEPYPDKSYNPKYKDYSALDKKYDVVISNAVLNVLPQDQRDALVVKMGELLNDGGRIFINVRGKDVESLAKTGKNIHLGDMEWIETVKGSYQKGFTKDELVAYLKDALGDGFTVEKTNMFGAVSAIVTKDSGVQYSLTDSKGRDLSTEQQEFFKDSVVRDENGNLKPMYHGTSNGGHTVFDPWGKGRYGLFGVGIYLTDSKNIAESYTKKGKGTNPQVYETYLNIKNPMDMDAQADPEAWAEAFPDAMFPESGTNEDFYRAMEEYFEDEGFVRWEAEETAMEAIQNMGYDGITHIGGGRVNPDGERHQVYIAFDPEQVKNTDNKNPTSDPDIRYSLSDSEGRQLTREQAEYFKDSKARDRNGNLLKVYHTTNNDFTVFDKGRKGETTGDYNTYLGFFFADTPEYMSQFPEFENGKTETYYLNMKNPIDMNNISRQAFLDIVEATGGDVQEAAEHYDREYADELKRAKFRGDNSPIMEMSRLLEDLTGEYFDYAEFYNALKPNYEQLMSKGYDGVINSLDGRGWANEYIVLDSNQAKLTSNTNPTSDPDIRYSLSDSKPTDNDVQITDSGTVTKYSLSSWTPETQAKVRVNLVNAGYDVDRVDKWIQDTNGVASVIAADRDRLDFVAADNQTMLKNNQEYVKTLDASTLCAKRLVYQGTFDAIQHRLPNTMLSSDDLIDLLNMMKEHGVQTPCGVCYVESRRRHLGKFAQEWLNGYDGEYKPNLDEVTTSDGLEALRKSHPDTYEDFITAMNKKGSSNPKVVQLRTEYRNEIMSLTPAQIRKIEAIGGLRVQSFSDFETPHLLDMMQAVMDMSAKGLSSQAYTKVPNFAWVFGDTGIKINLSLIAEGNGFDSDGNLAFSSVEGMDINEAMNLRDAYSQNVGTIIVGANDKHILACMADDRIDYIIPFHRSGWGARELDMMGMSSYTDYTYGQKEHDLATGKGLENLYPPDYWDYNLSGKENAERYLNLCARTGREPKFSHFLVNNGDGSYSLQPDGSTDGYWKTLIDFKMYDNEGNGVAQQKVQPNFNMDEAYRVLSEYEGGANKLPVANDVVEEFVAKYNDNIAPAMSMSDIGAERTASSDTLMYTRGYSHRDSLAEFAPAQEDIAPVSQTETAIETQQTEQNVPITEDVVPEIDLFPDDLAPMAEDEADTQARLASLDDADAPPEIEAPYPGEPMTPADPFADRDMKEVGNRKVKAYQYENPEVKPYFREAALGMLDDLHSGTKGEKWYNDDVYYESGGEAGWGGTKRTTTDDIAELLDSWHYTYEQIEIGLNAIIEDHGAENNAVSKRIEFMLDERLRNGYTGVWGEQFPANQDYINLLNEKQINEYSQEAFARFMETADQYAPPVEEDIAPVPVQATTDSAPVAEEYEAIRPKRQKAPVEVDDDIAPVYRDKLVRVDSNNGRPGEKQRKWVGTSTDSEAVDRKVLPDDLDQDVIHYQPISNKKTLGNANAKLDNMGYDTAVAYFNSQFANRRVSLDDVALGERLIQEAVKRGDTKTAGELIQNVAILGTELGQKVQALSIIKRLTPEGQLRMLQKTVERGKTKGDKAYEGVQLTQEMIDKILKTYNEDGSYDQNELNKVIEDVKQEIADQMTVTAMDKINAWRYLSMLGNPKTHIRNLVSNVAMKGTVAVKNAVARTIETVAPIQNRTKTWQAASADVKAFAARKAIEMKDVLSDGGKYSEDESIKQKRDIFKSKILNSLYEFNSDLLSKEDWWFSKPAFKNALSEFLTANGIRTEQDIKKNPKLVEKALVYATEQSQIATFRQYSWLANKLNEIERHNTATDIAVSSIMPFKKTPINIAKTGLNYSPLGFAKTLTHDISQVKSGKMEASELVDHLAQNLTGTALTLVGFMLAQSGLLSGGGEDDKEGEYDYQLGEQAYSLNIGGATYSLSWLSPVAMPLFVGANAYEQLVEGKEWNGDVVVETLAQTLDPLSEMSFLSGLDSVLSSYDSGIEKFAGIVEAMGQNYITQFAPTALSQVATVMDDTKRSTKVAADSDFKFVDQTINKLMYKIPGLRNLLEPSTDIWGNNVEQTENVLARAFETFLAPYSKREDISTAVDEEIKALYRETGEDGLIPNIPRNSVTYKDEKYEMSASEYTKFKNTYGQTAFDLMEKLFDTETYQSASAEDRADMVNKVYDHARDKAMLELLTKKGVEFTNAKSDGFAYYEEDAIVGAIENDLPLDEYSFSRDYPEKYEFFQSNGISYQDYADADEDGKRAYNWAYEYPDKYSVSKAVTSDLIEYKQYTGDLNDIRADKDSSGKTISGSAKQKKLDYINGLNIDYGAKIILFKMEYPSDDTYNYEIVEYLNGRSDISYEEEIAILKELGGTVLADGTVRWD